MSIALAATFNPRGEIGRLQRFFPQLQMKYSQVVISLPPSAQAEDVDAIRALPGVLTFVNEDWAHGRYMALRMALDTDAGYIHYADMDRLLRWVETQPDEWRRAVERIQQADCLVMGRTGKAYRTHPQALIQTEAISNAIVSHFLGQPMDVSAGSKAFSRRAAEFLAANTAPGRAMGADAEWPILLHRAGFRIDYLAVDGLDWESADRYQEQAADGDRQKALAEAYDREAKNWEMRVQVALEITRTALDVAQRELTEAK